jgi:uncharacterized protein YfaS (alpha-2-macroglobulin family)
MREHTFELLPYGRVRRSYDIAPSKAGEGILEAMLRTGSGGDRVRIGLPVIPFGEPWSHVDRRDLRDQLDFNANVEGPVVSGSERYEVVVESGVGAEILDGLYFLMGYPYGCLEQNLNRFVPALLLSKAFKDAGRPAPLSQDVLQALVKAGVLQLRAYQLDDGTFAYWPGGTTQPWVTAMALETLLWVRNSGFAVEQSFLASAIQGNVNLLNQAGLRSGGRTVRK